MIQIPNETLYDIAMASLEILNAREIISSEKDPLLIKKMIVREEVQYHKLICSIAEIGEQDGN